jgi:hypothetical protein
MREAYPRSVAPPRQRHTVAAGARLEVLQVEAEDIVALEHIGVALGDEPAARAQELLLVHLGARQDGGPAGRVGEGDCDDPVALARGVWELEARRGQHLDVQRKAPEVAQDHAAERGAARAEQVLMDGIAQEEIGPLGIARRAAGEPAALLARLLGLAPRGKGREPAVDTLAGEGDQLALARESVQEVRLGKEDEGAKGLLHGVDDALPARVDAHGGVAGRKGEEARGVVAAEEEGIAVERQRDRAQLSRLSSD